MSKNICIIGGGPVGITLGKELNEAGLDYSLYERESDFGGVWNKSSESGRVYESAHLISSKSITQLVDYPMPEEYPHYPSHNLVLEYWRDVAKTFGVYEKSFFNCNVTEIKKNRDGWDVTSSNREKTNYDLVFICNGLQRNARMPTYETLKMFSGELIHSKDYKNNSQVKDKRVLVIGAGNSGCDIAVDCVHSASKVFHSTKRGYYYQPKFIAGKPTADWMLSLGNKFKTKQETVAYMEQVFKLSGFDGTDYGLPKPDYPMDASHPILNSQILYYIGHGRIQPKKDVESFQDNRIRFVDGSSENVDIIICATGYDRDFSFLDSNYLEWKEGIPDLFLHMVPRRVDNLIFIGFINSASGFGSAIKSSVSFAKEYAHAFLNKTSGYKEFIQAKKIDIPDIGQNHFIDSFRHRWEVDLWTYLKVLNKYRSFLS